MKKRSAKEIEEALDARFLQLIEELEQLGNEIRETYVIPFCDKHNLMLGHYTDIADNAQWEIITEEGDFVFDSDDGSPPYDDYEELSDVLYAEIPYLYDPVFGFPLIGNYVSTYIPEGYKGKGAVHNDMFPETIE